MDALDIMVSKTNYTSLHKSRLGRTYINGESYRKGDFSSIERSFLSHWSHISGTKF